MRVQKPSFDIPASTAFMFFKMFVLISSKILKQKKTVEKKRMRGKLIKLNYLLNENKITKVCLYYKNI